MIAVAKATNRTFILPDINHYERYLPAWELIDTETLEGHIEVRPRRFFEKAIFEVRTH